MNTITRKIQIIINDDENYKSHYKTLYNWQEMTFRAYNFVSTHLYIQAKLDEFTYFTEEYRLKLANQSKDPEGILNTSQQNTTYRLLSEKFKGTLPSDIYANINSVTVQSFQAEKKDYFSGKKSLRSYKRNAPIPFSAYSLVDISPLESENYSFTLFKIPFKTNFGKDLSGNKAIFDRSLNGDYKLCASSLQLEGTKIFLLAVFQFESDKIKLDPKKEVHAKLDLYVPIIASFKKRELKIGTKEEFLHRRIQIQQALQRTQSALQFNSGGKGREKKLKKLEEWKNLESNYIKTKLHLYSKKLINFCIESKAGTLYLNHDETILQSLEASINDIKKREDLSNKEKNILINNHKFVLRNWSWNGLNTFITYKAKREGIQVFFEK